MYVPVGEDFYCLLANCFLFFCRNSAVFIFPTLLADFKDQIKNRDRDHAMWAELHLAHTYSILLLLYRCHKTTHPL